MPSDTCGGFLFDRKVWRSVAVQVVYLQFALKLGLERKLVLAFDIGTTYSGVAFAFLDPGVVPEINSVTKYINDPRIGSAKVPSTIYYDQDGNFRGVENGLLDEEDLLQLRWWKLILGPTELSAELKNQMSNELPKGKTIVDVFSDFMRYLFDSTKALFISSDPLGDMRWNTVSDNIELVLTHPNGWGGAQQSQLRTAAVRANIVPDTPEGYGKVHFVSEGEASFNFCATRTQAGENVKHGDRVLIVDAGGGTIDISSYVVTGKSPLRVDEAFQPKCLLQGGEFVTARAREMVSEKLKQSKFNTPEDIATFAQKFDEGTKTVFSDDKTIQYVKFGSPRDNDPKHGIKTGKLTLTGEQVAGFFEPSIQSTVDAIRESFTEILSMNPFAFLVGGFASSPWLANQLDRRLSDLGFKFFKPDTNTNKAVAVGAVSFCIDNFVSGRVSRYTYGIPCSVPYHPVTLAHIKREHETYIDVEGEKCIPDAFEVMLLKGTKILKSQEVRVKMRVVREKAPAKDILMRIAKYDGNLKEPRWMDVEQDKFGALCYVAGDISDAPCTLKVGESGKLFFYREFNLVLSIGPTELEAQMLWFDHLTGKENRTSAVIVYEDLEGDTRGNPRACDVTYKGGFFVKY